MHTVPSRLAWRSLREIRRTTNWTNFTVWRSQSWQQFTETSTKYVFPAERSLLKLRSKQTKEANNFSALFWREFFSSTWRSTKIFPNVLSATRGKACVMSHVILVSQSYCRVNDLGGKIPTASLLFVWPAGRSSPKRFAECCHKENFQDLSKPSKCWYYRQFSEFAIGR